MSNLDSYKNIHKYTDAIKNLSFSTIVLVVVVAIVVKIYVFNKFIEPDFEKDYHNNPILAEHGIIELKDKIDINEFHVSNASDQSIYTMSSFNGKILVLIVWSTNCTICNVEMRTISGLTNRIKTESDDQLQFVTIADQHSDPDKILSLFKRERFNRLYALYAKKGDFLSKLDIDESQLPRYFIVNRKGIVFAEMKHPSWYKQNILEPLYAFTLTENNESTNYDLALISEAMKKYRTKQEENKKDDTESR